MSQQVWCSIHKKLEPRRTEFRHRQGIVPKATAARINQNPFSIIPESRDWQHERAVFPRALTAAPTPLHSYNAISPLPSGNVTMGEPLQDHVPLPEEGDYSGSDMFATRSGVTIDSEAFQAAVDAAQRQTWTNRTHQGTAWVEDGDDDFEDTRNDEEDDCLYEMDPEVDEAEHADGGLPATDMVDEDFERELFAIGKSSLFI